MRHLARAILVCFGYALIPSVAAGQAACRAIDGKVDVVRKQIVRIVTATDAKTIALRNSLRLPAAQSTDIVLVTDTAICQSAATAITRSTFTDPNATIHPVWVLKVGTSRYVVFSPEYDISGEFSDYVIFDENFTYLATLVS